MPVPTTNSNQQDSNQPGSEQGGLPPVSRQDIINCAFTSWYDQFRRVTFRSKSMLLPESFIRYLNEDGIYLPDDGQPLASATIDELDDSDNESFPSTTDDDHRKPHFPEIEQFIRDTIQEFGGAVFPKLTWSAPRDAAWISATQSLKCTSPFDVFLLLKSSDFINHDLHHAFEHCTEDNEQETQQQHFLTLRKWSNLQPSMEFRCFVKDKEIIGITQRDITYYSFLADMAHDLENTIHDFFEDEIRDKFSSSHYVFDVYVQRDGRRAWLVDFNPLSPTTDSLLYSWEELVSLDKQQDPEFRFIQSEAEANAHANNAPSFASNMVPKDVIDLSDGKTIAEFAEEFQKAMMLAGDNDGDDDDEDDDSKESKHEPPVEAAGSS